MRGKEIPPGWQFLYGVRLYGVRLGKREGDRRAILFELESTALRHPCPFFQDYMLGYGEHFDREYVYAATVVKGAS